MKIFIVACTCLMNCETVLERIEAVDWKEAVQKHTKYPFRAYREQDAGETYELTTVTEVLKNYESNEESESEDFKDACYQVDNLMEWVEI